VEIGDMASRNRNILIIDDDALFREAISEHFIRQHYNVIGAGSGAEGLKLCAKNRIDMVLLDQKLPDGQGVDFCPDLLSYNEQTKIIFVTAYPTFDNAVDAIKVGAYDYLSKPFEMKELDLILNKAMRTLDLEQVEQLQNYKNHKESVETILVGRHHGLSDVDRLIDLAAYSDAPVLLTGKTGTGKNLVAKSIHYRSPVKHAAYVSINCASLPENLIEAELFGYEKGAFTGAVSRKKGIFEMAEGGTLFLDEIGELPLHLQSKLLGVLDEKKIKRLGGEVLRPVAARIIAATNLDLDRAIEQRRFRDDLYYRLSVLRIHIPPLQDHIEDVPRLCRYFIGSIAPSIDLTISARELDALMAYHWPGNIRELKNVIERSIILRSGPDLQPSKLLLRGNGQTCHPPSAAAGPKSGRSRPAGDANSGTAAKLKAVERNHIQSVLRTLSHNHTQAAKALGISRSTLMRKIKAYGLNP
jgi:DNA-binding NtrC family response regulator